MNPPKFKLDTTIEERYKPAMYVTTKEEAAEYFEALVFYRMTYGHTREEAERIERSNLGYFSGYFGRETMIQVQELFSCEHPVFGKEPPQK